MRAILVDLDIKYPREAMARPDVGGDVIDPGSLGSVEFTVRVTGPVTPAEMKAPHQAMAVVNKMLTLELGVEDV